jgi:hypothetical protein
MKIGPHISDFDLGYPVIYEDQLGRKWEILCKLDQPALTIQRVGLVGVINPLEFMRLTIIPGSPWAQEHWTREQTPNLRIV